MGNDGEYVCMLDPQTQQKAQEELNEDPPQRTSQIKALRQWVENQPHINSRTDDAFLLRFLRVAKFSQLRAQEWLTNFWTARSVEVPEWFQNMDPNDKRTQEILDLGAHVILPGRDDEGRKVCLVRAGSYDPKLYTLDEIMKVSFMVHDILMLDESTQINGIVILQNFDGIHTGHLFAFSRDVISKASKCWQNVYPFRHKGTHFLNTPAFLNPIFDLFNYFMKEKARQRRKFHKRSLESLHSSIPKRILPTELGGDAGPLKDIIKENKELMIKHRDDFLLNAQYGIDLRKRPAEDRASSGWGVVGSFRKLTND